MKKLVRRIGTLVAGLAILSACAEPATAPLAPSDASSASLIGDARTALAGFTDALGVQRTAPLATSLSVTQTIGEAGGTLSIPQAGVTVVVPPGAVSAPVAFTMTARQGALIAYDFAPHGLVFAKPLVFTQQLSGTNATLVSAPLFQLGYYSDPAHVHGLSAFVSQFINGSVNFATWTFTSSIPHFSGYIMSGS